MHLTFDLLGCLLAIGHMRTLYMLSVSWKELVCVSVKPVSLQKLQYTHTHSHTDTHQLNWVIRAIYIIIQASGCFNSVVCGNVLVGTAVHSDGRRKQDRQRCISCLVLTSSFTAQGLLSILDLSFKCDPFTFSGTILASVYLLLFN